MTFLMHNAPVPRETLRPIAPSPLRGEGRGEGFRASNHHSATTGTVPLCGQLTESLCP